MQESLFVTTGPPRAARGRSAQRAAFGAERQGDADAGRQREIRARLYRLLKQADASIEQCCAALDLSVAELRRRLASEGTSFRQVRREVIVDAARRYLERGAATEDIALLLGYSDGRSFRRAIKLAGGGSIVAIRRGARAAAAERPGARAGGDVQQDFHPSTC